jgi:transcriptional regulator with XRE-family HTH domain
MGLVVWSIRRHRRKVPFLVGTVWIFVLFTKPSSKKNVSLKTLDGWNGKAQGFLQMHVGHRIKALRTEIGIALSDLAKKSDISKGLLHQIENSETPPNPSLDTLNKVSKGLGITIAILLEKSGVKAKRIIPDKLEEGLAEMINLLHKQGLPINEAALDSLYVLQERGGGPKSAQQWRFLYDGICLVEQTK